MDINWHWYRMVRLGRRLIGSVLFVPIAVCTALLPTLSRMSKEDPGAFMPMVRRLTNMMVIAVVPFAAVMMFAPMQILYFMHYPASFVSSVPVLFVLGGGAVVWYLSQVVGTALIASDLQGMLSRITGIAAIISVPLCIVLSAISLRWFNNAAAGAAVSDVIVEGYLLIAYVRALPQSPLGWSNVVILGRSAVAAAPLVIALLTLTHHALLFGVLAGAALYLPLCVLLRCFEAQDISVMRLALTKRPPVEQVAGGQYAAK